MRRAQSGCDPGGLHFLLEFDVLIGGGKRLNSALTRQRKLVLRFDYPPNPFGAVLTFSLVIRV